MIEEPQQSMLLPRPSISLMPKCQKCLLMPSNRRIEQCFVLAISISRIRPFSRVPITNWILNKFSNRKLHRWASWFAENIARIPILSAKLLKPKMACNVMQTCHWRHRAGEGLTSRVRNSIMFITEACSEFCRVCLGFQLKLTTWIWFGWLTYKQVNMHRYFSKIAQDNRSYQTTSESSNNTDATCFE